MKRLLNRISTFWFFALPITVTLLLLLMIQIRFVASNTTRVMEREMNRSLLEVTRHVETTLRVLMINNPREIKEFHQMLDSLRGDRTTIDIQNRARREQIAQLEKALHLISGAAGYQVAGNDTVNQLRAKYHRQMQDIAPLPARLDIRTTIIPAPVVREEMLQAVLDDHPERYPLPDEIETLVIATGKQYRGKGMEKQQPYLQITSPVLAGAACMRCHLSAIRGQPMAALTVRADLKSSMSGMTLLGNRMVLFSAMMILVVLLILLLISRYLTTSLNGLYHQVRRFADGDYQTGIHPQGTRETARLAAVMDSSRRQAHDIIYTILNNVPALFLIVDKAGRATSIYSRLVSVLFGDITGKNVNETVFQPCGKDLSSVLEMVFAENGAISFEELTALAPGELEISGRAIRLTYHPIYRGIPQELVQILVIGEDLSTLRQSEKARAAEQKQFEMILEIVRHPLDYLEFYKNNSLLIASGQQSMQRDDGLLTDTELIEIYHLLHTLKEEAAIFPLDHLVTLAHTYESRLFKMKNRSRAIGRKVIDPMLVSLSKALEKTHALYLKYFGEEKAGELIPITQDEVDQLLARHPDLQPEIVSWKAPLQLEFIRRKARIIVRAAARELGKEVKVTVTGEEGRISSRTAEVILLALTGILRMTVGQAIEDPMIREAVGKWPWGTIRIQVENKAQNIQITIQDDGQGFHPDSLVNRAIELGLIKPGTKVERKQALNLIFKPGFSTALSISNLSGHSPGLDTVKNAINRNRGMITVRSQSGFGTEYFIIMHRNPDRIRSAHSTD
ncbi:hypothetical protein KKI24_13945 [bacterium]|nr:hypothetical protein [bacterium]